MKHLFIHIICTVFILGIQKTSAQIVCTQPFHDFGNVTEDSSRTFDFVIQNNYSKIVTINYFGFNFDVSSTFSSHSIPGDSSVIFRVKITSSNIGPLEESFVLKFWDIEDSLELSIKANVLSFDNEENYPVEAFPKQQGENDENEINVSVNFKIIDSETKTPIENARIYLNTNELRYKNIKTNDKGEVSRIVNNSYNVNISAPGYMYFDGNINVSCNDSVRIIELKKYDTYSTETLATQIEDAKVQSDDDIQTIEDIIAVLDDEPINTPLDDRFKANNIVFLLDISVSMIDHDRIDLLKSSIVNMIKILRPRDRLSVITFNTHTNVLIDPTFVTDENINTLIYKIRKLKATGLTNGGEGLQMAYKFIETHFDSIANNQVILSTDGGLNSYIKHDEVLEMVSSHNEKIKTSIILLKGYDYSKKYMSEITSSGKGHLLMIDNSKTAKTMLIKEIKSNSFISQD